MAKKEEKSLIAQRISWLIWGFLAALVILLVSAFSTAWRTNQALKAELATLQPIVAAAQAEQETLKERLDYVKSEQYVAEWSRMRAGMTHSGETLVISIAVTPTAQCRSGLRRRRRRRRESLSGPDGGKLCRGIEDARCPRRRGRDRA